MSRWTSDFRKRGQSFVTIVAVSLASESKRYTVLELTDKMHAASLIVINSSM
jgi:hypothetical protein